MVNDDSSEPKIFRVLSLDGGGAKGFYTLGALKEIEALVECRLCEKFDLIYGTSTGAIIAALLGLGKSVDEIEALYRKHVVTVMARWLPSQKTAALEALAAEVFGELKFDAFKTDMGIVGTRWNEERPIIFKTNRRQAFLGKATFEPGFGCTIGDAIVGSCSAYPFFKKKFVTTSREEKIEVRDGGFVANNPALYAIVDATESLGLARKDVRVVSIGVGEYQQTWINCFNHIVTADRDKLVCANYMHWLVRDNSPTSWPAANFNTFTAALKKYWES